VTDADDLHRTLSAAGVAIVAPPTDGPFGRFFVISDPDGYTLTLHQAA
jgi:predicted enzyme related to lactoylglutathione lyase